MKRWSQRVFALFAVLLASCVPSDTSTETPRGGVVATLRGEAPYPRAARQFDDGWSVRIERITQFANVNVKPANFTNTTGSSDACYGRGNYEQATLIRPDVVNVQELRAINVGTCAAEISIMAPYVSQDASARIPLGPGVEPADAQAFDDYTARNAMGGDTGGYFSAAIHLVGTGTKGARTLKFDVFVAPSSIFDPRLELSSGYGVPTTDNPITIVPDDKIDLAFDWNDYVFFRTDTAPGAALQFEAWAYADERGNHDGVVTTEELEAVSLGRDDYAGSTPIRAPGRFAVSTSKNYPSGFTGTLMTYIGGQSFFGWTRAL